MKRLFLICLFFQCAFAAACTTAILVDTRDTIETQKVCLEAGATQIVELKADPTPGSLMALADSPRDDETCRPIDFTVHYESLKVTLGPEPTAGCYTLYYRRAAN